MMKNDDEELRKLLRSAENILGSTSSATSFTATSSLPRKKDATLVENIAIENKNLPDARISQEARDLATLLDSLSNDLKSELISGETIPRSTVTDRQKKESVSKTKYTPPSPTSSFSAHSLQDSDIDFDPLDAVDYSDSISSDGLNNDVSIVRFGVEYSLRGKHGLYLTAIPNSVSISGPASTAISKDANHPSSSQQYVLGCEGQGVGDALDCLQFINTNQKDDSGPVRYGMTVSLKAPAAKERLLGLRDGTKLGFWRNLVGQGEKWVLLKAATVATGGRYYQQTAANSGKGATRVSYEEANSKGTVVHLGDMILLQTFKTDNLLTLQIGAGGPSQLNSQNYSSGGSAYSLELVYRDRSGMNGLGLPDAEIWQIEQFGSIPTPLWFSNRPYLSGSYLSIPSSMKPLISELEARAFPGARSPEGVLDSYSPTSVAPLNSLPLSSQHLILLRELLSTLSGVEGVYIKVKDSKVVKPPSNNANNNSSIAGLNSSVTITKPRILSNISLTLDADMADKSIASLVSQLLPVCESALKVRVFTRQQSQYEYGMVSHAMCAAMKRILRDFDKLVAQMEHLYSQQNLSLQKMVFLLQPSKVTLYQLEQLCARLSGLTGGRLLDVLHGVLLEQGDRRAREMHSHLLDEAYKPFLTILQQWIERGELLDPYKEFMVLEDASISKEALQEDFNAHYWDSRYKLRTSHIPRLLQSHAIKLLSAGKFLNVVRGAGDWPQGSGLTEGMGENDIGAEDGAAKEPEPLSLSLEASDSPMLREIEKAYIRSSNSLLTLLEKGHGLSGHLDSLRRFFLLEHGDFFIQFMDSAEDELRKDVKDVSLQRIQALLQLAVQTSTLCTDPHREDLTCSLAAHNLIQHLHLIQSAGDVSSPAEHIGVVGQGLKGVEALTLDYKVGWPLSIVLSRRAITKYQLLSRLLYFSKHVERRVLASWMDHQYTKHLSMNIRVVMGPCYCLRHRMLHFLQNFVYYMTLEVIGPRGHELQRDLSVATDIDDVLELHEKFLDICLKECLLASQELLKTLMKIMTTCLLFADYMRKFSVGYDLNGGTSKALLPISNYGNGSSSSRNTHGVHKDETAARAAVYVQYVEREISHDSFNKMLAKFTETFDTQLKEFLDKLWTDSYRRHAQLSNLCIRLDYNGFYSNQFAT